MRSAKFGHGTNSNFMSTLVLAAKFLDNSTSALAGSHAAQHNVICLPAACACGATASMVASASVLAPVTNFFMTTPSVGRLL